MRPPGGSLKGIGKIDAGTDFIASGVVLHPVEWQAWKCKKTRTGNVSSAWVDAVTETGERVDAGKPRKPRTDDEWEDLVGGEWLDR